MFVDGINRLFPIFKTFARYGVIGSSCNKHPFVLVNEPDRVQWIVIDYSLCTHRVNVEKIAMSEWVNGQDFAATPTLSCIVVQFHSIALDKAFEWSKLGARNNGRNSVDNISDFYCRIREYLDNNRLGVCAKV